MNDDLKEQFIAWNIDSKAYDLAEKMVRDYGEELMGGYIDHLNFNTIKDLEDIQKQIDSKIACRVAHYSELDDAMCELFNFQYCCEFAGMLIFDDLISALVRKNIINIYETEGQAMIVVFGSKSNQRFKDFFKENYKKRI